MGLGDHAEPSPALVRGQLDSTIGGCGAGKQTQLSQCSVTNFSHMSSRGGPCTQPSLWASGPLSHPLHPRVVTCTSSLHLLLGLASPFGPSVGEPDLGRWEGAEAAGPQPGHPTPGSISLAPFCPRTRACHPSGAGVGRGRGLILQLLHPSRLQGHVRLQHRPWGTRVCDLPWHR